MAKHAIQQEDVPLSQIENDVLESLKSTEVIRSL